MPLKGLNMTEEKTPREIGEAFATAVVSPTTAANDGFRETVEEMLAAS